MKITIFSQLISAETSCDNDEVHGISTLDRIIINMFSRAFRTLAVQPCCDPSCAIIGRGRNCRLHSAIKAADTVTPYLYLWTRAAPLRNPIYYSVIDVAKTHWLALCITCLMRCNYTQLRRVIKRKTAVCLWMFSVKLRPKFKLGACVCGPWIYISIYNIFAKRVICMRVTSKGFYLLQTKQI